MSELTAILQTLRQSEGVPAVLATLVTVEGSSYRRPGARALFIAGRRIGSISGGCLEEDVRLRAELVLRSGVPVFVNYDTTQENDLVWGMNVGCHGVVGVLIERIDPNRPHWIAALTDNLARGQPAEVAVLYGQEYGCSRGTHGGRNAAVGESGIGIYRERIEPALSLAIFGAGDDAIPLARMAKILGWRVTVVDSRSVNATRERFLEADALIVTAPSSMDEHVEIDPRSYAVVMTHRFSEDLALLRILLARPIAYLGLLGSRGRTERLLAGLRQEGISLDQAALHALHAPVGLDLGATTPEAIGLSILAEIQCSQTARLPLPLRDRAGAIHG